jgi:hypothetical protein
VRGRFFTWLDAPDYYRDYYRRHPSVNTALELLPALVLALNRFSDTIGITRPRPEESTDHKPYE